jgi:CBS domain-containing protein
MRTHQVMTRKVIAVGTAVSIVDATKLMLENHISGLPVVDGAGKLLGIISQGDFIRRAEIGTQRKRGRWLKLLLGPGTVASDFLHQRGRKVGEVMTLDPYTVTEDMKLEDVVELMERNDLKRLPVMRGDQLVES